MSDAYIVSAVRTPIGRFQGALASLPAPKLGAIAVREAVARARVDPERVNEVILGCVLQAGLGQAPARQAAIFGGIPARVPAFTVNKVCGSGLKAVILGAQAIRLGDADVVVAGGMESMTNAPYLAAGVRDGLRLGHGKLLDTMVHDGLWDVYNDFHMGESCECVADEYHVTREEMDTWAAESHRRAISAAREGKFRDEIVPVRIAAKKGETVVEADEGPRADATAEKLATLKPAFRANGRITPGNASQISDGAAAAVLMSERALKAAGAKPLARITGYASAGLEPKWVMMAPVEAVREWEARTGLRRADMDLVEINEAFAAQAVAVQKQLGIDPARLNVNGGAVALGHPIGASGTRILATLLHALAQRGLRRGLATLCLGGGNGVALSVERMSCGCKRPGGLRPPDPPSRLRASVVSG